jgi:hypothetical protein
MADNETKNGVRNYAHVPDVSKASSGPKKQKRLWKPGKGKYSKRTGQD